MKLSFKQLAFVLALTYDIGANMTANASYVRNSGCVQPLSKNQGNVHDLPHGAHTDQTARPFRPHSEGRGRRPPIVTVQHWDNRRRRSLKAARQEEIIPLIEAGEELGAEVLDDLGLLDTGVDAAPMVPDETPPEEPNPEGSEALPKGDEPPPPDEETELPTEAKSLLSQIQENLLFVGSVANGVCGVAIGLTTTAMAASIEACNQFDEQISSFLGPPVNATSYIRGNLTEAIESGETPLLDLLEGQNAPAPNIQIMIENLEEAYESSLLLTSSNVTVQTNISQLQQELNTTRFTGFSLLACLLNDPSELANATAAPSAAMRHYKPLTLLSASLLTVSSLFVFL